jgi:glycosyltransferase involved in cell wall biosynthesis
MLERCMRSLCDGKIFDEIVIVNTSGDEAVSEQAKKYTDKVLYHQWRTYKYPYGNFEAARNAALDASTTDYIWWQDADDIMWPEMNEKAMSSCKAMICNPANDVDVFFMDYVTVIDPDCNPLVSFRKDRVFKRTATRWSRPVHEQLFRSFKGRKQAVLRGVQSIHLPEKQQCESAERNVSILEHEVAERRADDVSRFFLARDMMLCGRIVEGVQLFETLFDEMRLDFPSLFAIALELCYYYGHGKMRLNPAVDDLNASQETEKWLRLALTLSQAYAEPYVLLGDLYRQRSNYRMAELLWGAALRKKPDGGQGLHITPYYKAVPAMRLAEMYELMDMQGKALWYNEVAMEDVNTPQKEALELRLRVLEKLTEQASEAYGRLCGN